MVVQQHDCILLVLELLHLELYVPLNVLEDLHIIPDAHSKATSGHMLFLGMPFQTFTAH